MDTSIERGSWRGITLALAVWAVSACNAVLGIEEAKVDPTFSALSYESPDNRARERCETTGGCESCLVEHCSDEEIDGCVKDSDCRKALVAHRNCVGDDCRDEGGSCGQCLAREPGASCMAECGTECEGGEIMPLQKLFCTCMTKKCPGRFAAGVDDFAACIDRHEETEDWELACLLTHCELATVSEDHCLHAIDGELRQCTEQPEPVDNCAASKGLLGYGCEKGVDCCSGFCRATICAP